MAYSVSSSPHLHEGYTTTKIMWQVVIALLPALAASCWFFGWVSLFLTLVGVVAAVLTEALIQYLRKVPITVYDGSAVVTGMLLTFNVSASAPWWLVVVGSVFAIAIGKQVFGGLGNNPMNPALLGRAFLVAAWPSLMVGRAAWCPTTTGTISGFAGHWADKIGTNPAMQRLITSATPLDAIKNLRNPDFIATLDPNAETARQMANQAFDYLTHPDSLINLFWGNVGGCLGEVSAAALLLGAAFLVMRHIIEWRIPTFYLGTVFVLTWVFGGTDGLFSASVLVPVFHLLAGGLLLGALFMATDMVTSPVTKKGRIIFGIGLGLLTTVIRFWGGYPEGVSYSILLMNICVPLIDRWTMPRPFGEVKK